MVEDAEVGELLALAAALTGRADGAADLVGEAIAIAGVRSGKDEHGPTLRNLLVQRYLVRRRSALLADPVVPDLSTDLAGISGRLDELSTLQRAALVLSVRERLTQAEIAGVLDRPVAVIGRTLGTAQVALGVSSGEIASALLVRSGRAPEPAQARRAAHQHTRVRARTRRRRGLLVVLAGAIALALTGVTVVVQGGPAYVRSRGEWSYAFDFRVPPGWEVVDRSLSPDHDEMTLHATYGQSPPCIISVSTGGATPAIPAGRELTVDGHPGVVAPGEDHRPGSYLWWTFAPGAAAEINCVAETSDATYLDLAHRIRFRRTTLAVPFDLTRLPADEQVRAVTVGDQTTSAWLVPRGDLDVSEQAVELSVSAEASGPDDRLRLCRNADRVCASSFFPRVPTPDQKNQFEVRSTTLLDRVTLAPDLTDPATWFDARQVIPR